MLHCNRLQGDCQTGSHPAATADLLLQILRASIYSNPVNMVTVTKLDTLLFSIAFFLYLLTKKKKK